MQEFEFICPNDMDRSPDSVFSKTLNNIKLQTALSTLRENNGDIDAFKAQVNLLFPANKKAPDTQFVGRIRSELLAVNNGQVPSLLSKF